MNIGSSHLLRPVTDKQPLITTSQVRTRPGVDLLPHLCLLVTEPIAFPHRFLLPHHARNWGLSVEHQAARVDQDTVAVSNVSYLFEMGSPATVKASPELTR